MKLLVVVLCKSEETCVKRDVCSCKFKNGSIVDLRPADGGKSGPRFTDIKGDQDRTFAWNPCTPFNTSSGCSNILVCQETYDGHHNAGTQDTKFSVDTNGNVVISYGGSKDESGNTRESKITLKCNPSQPGYGTIPKFTETMPSAKTTLYSATFTSQFSCAEGGSSGLSPGSIILIIFFPLVLMYVIVGILINRYGRGIESIPELLPNHSFWADFPFLVKDGIVLTFGCVKAGCSSLSRKCGKDGYAEI